jgi:hypothetical protein
MLLSLATLLSLASALVSPTLTCLGSWQLMLGNNEDILLFDIFAFSTEWRAIHQVASIRVWEAARFDGSSEPTWRRPLAFRIG